MNDTRQHEAPRIRLEEDVEKILAAIRYVIVEAGKKELSVTQYDIVKTIFLADRAHLNEYGRPITFDNYVAMEHGPVPSLTYDFLKGNDYILKKYGIKSFGWKKYDIKGSKKSKFSITKSYKDEGVLSASDKEALSSALIIVESLGFGQIRKLTHEDPAYEEAWKGDGEKKHNMSYGMLFNSPDYEAAELVRHLSENK